MMRYLLGLCLVSGFALFGCVSDGPPSQKGMTNTPGEPQKIAFVTPKPSYVQVEPPGPNVPKSLASFSGMWAGDWTGGFGAGLIVEKVRPTGATVIYSWGTSQWFAEGWRRVRGNFQDGKLHLRLRSANVTYSMRADGRLYAEYDGGTFVSNSILAKVEP